MAQVLMKNYVEIFFHSALNSAAFIPKMEISLDFLFVLLRDKTPKQFLFQIYHMGLINLREVFFAFFLNSTQDECLIFTLFRSMTCN